MDYFDSFRHKQALTQKMTQNAPYSLELIAYETPNSCQPQSNLPSQHHPLEPLHSNSAGLLWFLE